jgi:hypothetical protein
LESEFFVPCVSGSEKCALILSKPAPDESIDVADHEIVGGAWDFANFTVVGSVSMNTET